MAKSDFVFKTREGKYDIEAAVRLIGTDLLVAIWGGEKPHIGAVATALPRPSLSDSRRISASASVYCFVGHKEDQLARTVALKIASALNTPVVVTAGIHWDNLDEAGIKTVLDNSRILTDLILERLSPLYELKEP
jgi:hypothetical protein